MRRGAVGACVAPLFASVVTLVGPAPAAVAAEAPCSVDAVLGTERLSDSTQRGNPPLERMHVREAQRLTRGRGVDVAVIDSGIQTGVTDLAARPARVDTSPIQSAHGTIVAGLVAGPDGVAPEASLVDVKVYDAESADDGDVVTSDAITRGVRRVIALDRQDPVEVVTIALSVRADDPGLGAAIEALRRQTDAVVVAAAGNVPSEGPAPGFDGTRNSDADVYPADYEGVVAVSAVPPPQEDPRAYVLPNADTDVAAPTVGAISVVGTGQRCEISEVATSWAAAEVAGVVALLRARHPDDNAEQVVARLVRTAEGSAGRANPWTGAGVVQALDALTRVLTPAESGEVAASRPVPAESATAPPPPERVDLFGPARTTLLWAGLLAGGLIALAFTLRPVLRRR